MTKHVKIALLAFTLASAPVFAQDRGPGSPSAPNTQSSTKQTARDAAKANCEKLSGTERDQCMRDFEAKTGSRTEPSVSGSNPQRSDADKASGGTTTVR